MDLDSDAIDSDGRQKWLTGIRFFKDQLESLDWLVIHKHRNNRKRADLIREAVDQYIEREKDHAKT
jgi:metal-responsive CopG/Arc/MetJ family transcriptional regulator